MRRLLHYTKIAVHVMNAHSKEHVCSDYFDPLYHVRDSITRMNPQSCWRSKKGHHEQLRQAGASSDPPSEIVLE